MEVRSDFEERELKDALLKNIEMFLMELGRGFAYMGREYRLQVGETEQFLDMLFYNTNLRCYIVIEVKTGKFEPSFIGQLGTYVAAVNHILKTEHDNPTLGILICKDKDNVLAKYSLESSAEPLAVSEYELAKLYPVDFKSSLPTIEEIENFVNDIPLGRMGTAKEVAEVIYFLSTEKADYITGQVLDVNGGYII